MSNYYIGANGVVYRSDELCHYGVPGMKWGKRKASYYDAKSRDHAAKIATSKTRIGKTYHNYRAYRNEVKALDKKAGEKLGKGSILKDIDSAYGHGATARMQKAASGYYDRKSQYTKTGMGTAMAKANAYNLKTASQANSRLHDSKSLTAYGKNMIDSMANRSIKTWSGRTTTTGKAYVDNLLTGGMIGFGQDVSRYSSKKASAKNTYKKTTDKAFEEYERTIADIEKNYKRGQRLSKEDQAREAAAEEKYASAAAKAKADYKKARRNWSD